MGETGLNPLNVVCVKVKPRYDADYVNKLYRAVKRNLTLPFNFFCITDDARDIDESINIISVEHEDLPGWWQKLVLFKPLDQLKGRVLYLDLDTIITGSLDEMAAYSGDFIIVKPFYRASGFMSSVMAFESGFGRQVWTRFMEDPQAAMDICAPLPERKGAWGDQRWLEICVDQADYWQDLYPGQMVSFKANVLPQQRIPADTRVILFHGEPRPHEAGDWVRQFWD